MACRSFNKLAGQATRQLVPISSQRSFLAARSSTVLQSTTLAQRLFVASPMLGSSRSFASSTAILKGLSPESDNPKPTRPEGHTAALMPTEVTVEEYHTISDKTMDEIVAKLEQLQEDREDVDVEFSVRGSSDHCSTRCTAA